MIAVGYFATHKKWLDDSAMNFIAKMVVNVALPSNMISKISATYTRRQLYDLRFILLIPLATMLACYLIGFMVAHIFKLPSNRRGTFCAMFAMSNTIFMGLPVNLALFGSDSEAIVYIYYMANTCLFWSIAVNMIGWDGQRSAAQSDCGKKIPTGQSVVSRLIDFRNLKRVLNGGFVGLLIGVIVVLAGVEIPVFLNDTLKYFGAMVTPLPMLFIGNIIYKTNWKQFKFTKDIPLLFAGRFIISPMLVFVTVMLINKFVNIDTIVMNVFVTQAAMPVMSQTPIIAKGFGADADYAAIMTSFTTLASLVVIPVIKVLM